MNIQLKSKVEGINCCIKQNKKKKNVQKYNLILSFRLEWSPVHKSAKFWRENALRLNEKNYDLLRTLIHFLEVSKDPLVLAVASYDIGEYVRHNPRGKQLVIIKL